MPAYTLGEIMSQATFNVGRRSDLELSRVSFLANEAYMEVADIAPLALSERTVSLSLMSGSASTAIPPTMHEAILLSWMSGGSGTTIERVGIGAIDSSGTGGGVPTVYAPFAGNFEFRPIPDSDMTAQLRFRVQISDMTETSSVPSMNTAWRPAIVRKLEEKLHYALKDYEAAELAQQRYLSLIGSLKNDDARRQIGQRHVGMTVVS